MLVDDYYNQQIEVNENAEDEFRYLNGQCMHRIFHFDETGYIECIDSSDARNISSFFSSSCDKDKPIMRWEDVACSIQKGISGSLVTNVCGVERCRLFAQALFSIHAAYLSNQCWLALICRIYYELSSNTPSEQYCWYWQCSPFITQHCPHNHALYFLSMVPELYGHLHFPYV